MSVPSGNVPQTGAPRGLGRADQGTGNGIGNARAAGSIENNAALSQRAQSMLPPGSNVSAAATGFRSEADFLTALHASHSMSVPFDDVKRKMTDGSGMSLDRSIHALRPDLDKNAVKQGVKDAKKMAKDDLRAAKGNNRGASALQESTTGAQLRINSALSARVTPLLPGGVTLDQASAGFRNTGQFVAALHVSHNLGIPFSELRARMIAGGESLGEAIHGTRPAMGRNEIEAAVRTAEESARNDLKADSSAAASANVPDRNL
jgi:hypothetical protein